MCLSVSANRQRPIVGRYISIQEKDFEWLTEQLVSLANKCCNGRIVSALEGGYRIQGGIVSAFARSVAAHVRALSASHKAEWSWEETKAEQQRERRRRVCLMPCPHIAFCTCLVHSAWQTPLCVEFAVSGAPRCHWFVDDKLCASSQCELLKLV